ncbi:uncharacterized protein LOC133918100 [Phragmites australis]|uniref:uncharacterized protein LOC133918100 n=1 Tax=Phragmites australis TaxID=29695 RepID=UPI002D79F7A4|nr:uncharacterized protein LOC133918100 [Phragmites australis]
MACRRACAPRRAAPPPSLSRVAPCAVQGSRPRVFRAIALRRLRRTVAPLAPSCAASPSRARRPPMPPCCSLPERCPRAAFHHAACSRRPAPPCRPLGHRSCAPVALLGRAQLSRAAHSRRPCAPCRLATAPSPPVTASLRSLHHLSAAPTRMSSEPPPSAPSRPSPRSASRARRAAGRHAGPRRTAPPA